MPGPPPKHPSVRARRNNPTSGFKQLPSTGVPAAQRPPWPLKPDIEMVATLELTEDQIASMQADLAECEDGRKKGRLRKDIAAAELRKAILRAKLDEASELEVDLWNKLWSDPQAALWSDSVAFQRTVATYVRWQIRNEQGDIKAEPAARQLSDRLGLSPLALQRLRAEVENADAAEERGKARRERKAPKKKPDGGDDPRLTLVG